MHAPLATSFLQDQNFIRSCYIVAFGLFIYGLYGLTGPRTAVRGNRIAAVGMAIGAGWGGARAMTATSGPGISLMSEFVGLAYFA